MCGIAGFSWEDDGLGRRCTDELAPRGPDGSGVYVADGVTLAHTRLAIIDLSSKGDQPMTDDEGRCIVFNGEIYNFRELRERLEREGQRFVSDSDTEVILHGYARWGTRIFSMLQGMFAIAIHDAHAQRLVLARDPTGIKPLFLARPENGLAFASTIHVIRSICELHELDTDAIRSYLRHHYVPGARTLFKGINDLLPGHYAVFDLQAQRLITKKYFFLEESYLPDSLRRLRDATDAVVSRQMIADVPIGAFLSGGVDSSFVVAKMQALSDDPIRTYTVHFDGCEDADTKSSRVVAEHCGTQHTPVEFDSAKVIARLPEIMAAYDGPMGEAGAIPNYILSERARKDVKVVLAGEGGDEVFGGYTHQRHQVLIMRAHWWIPSLARRTIRSISPERIKHLMVLGRYDYLSQNHAIQAFTTDEIKDFSGSIPPRPELGLVGDNIRSPIHRTTYLDMKTLLPFNFNVKADRMTMAHGLEERVPLQDPMLVKLSMTISSSEKARRGKGKVLLKRLASEVLPKEVVFRKKMGFQTPVAKWLLGELGELAREELSESRLVEDGLLRDSFSSAGKRLTSPHKLWTAFALERWYRHLR